MTREEALREIKELVHLAEYVDNSYVDGVHIEVMKIAIGALMDTEVVRCKDCKHWSQNGWCAGLPINGDDATYLEMSADDYCSYGERKEESCSENPNDCTE